MILLYCLVDIAPYKSVLKIPVAEDLIKIFFHQI